MATQQFETAGPLGRRYRYTPTREVRFNGVRGHFWERRELHRGCWVYCDQQFHPLRATRKDIA